MLICKNGYLTLVAKQFILLRGFLNPRAVVPIIIRYLGFFWLFSIPSSSFVIFHCHNSWISRAGAFSLRSPVKYFAEPRTKFLCECCCLLASVFNVLVVTKFRYFWTVLDRIKYWKLKGVILLINHFLLPSENRLKVSPMMFHPDNVVHADADRVDH